MSKQIRRPSTSSSLHRPVRSVVGSAILVLLAAGLISVVASPFCVAQDPDSAPTKVQENGAESEPTSDAQVAAVEEQTIPIPEHWKRLGRPGGSEVWLDMKNKTVIVAGHICLTRGGLEMFVCPVNTKEHESVIAAHAAASEVHAALLAVGAKQGKPVQWEPEYQPASGSIIEVKVTWSDPQSGRLLTRWGKEMVRDFRNGLGLSNDWIFGGSILEKDPESGESYYYADSGPLVCVSNFATATMDLNVASTAADGGLLYEAYTENVPPKGTKVYVFLKPGKFFEAK